MDASVSFGQWIKQRRKLLDLTQDALARQAGCAVVTLRKIEADEMRPSRQMAENLIDSLDVPQDQRAHLLLVARGLSASAVATAPGQAVTPTRATNLLPSSNPLLGRDAQIADLCALLGREDVRLLTLTGPPGIGKTRLSLRMAHDMLAEFEDGVFFVALAPIADPGLVVQTIAQVLDVKESAGRSVQESLHAFLRDRHMLIVLDNFEQVVDAAPAIAELLAAAPRLKVLVTSREVLHLYAEWEYPVPPLALPDVDNLPAVASLLEYPTVALFVQRAQAVNPDFTLNSANAQAVAELCVRLDGLPLAIELAAARSKLFGPRALLSRLNDRLALLETNARDLPARQRTLRGAIAWSYHLLGDDEQVLFRRLGVFVGGWDLRAVEAVVELALREHVTEGRETESRLDSNTSQVLFSLVDKSLVWQSLGPDGEPRFTMLETILEYAREQLKFSGEYDHMRQSHAEWYTEWACSAWLELRGPRQQEWLDQLSADHANLRAALGHLLETKKVELGLRLAGTLWPYWAVRGHLREGRQWLTDMLALAEQEHFTDRPTYELGRALNGLGHLVMDMGDDSLETAYKYITQSLEVWRALGDKAEMAWAYYGQGGIKLGLNRDPEAIPLYEQALALWREVGDKWGEARALDMLGEVHLVLAEFDKAEAFHTPSLAIFLEMGDQQGVARAQMGLGVLATIRGQYDRARGYLEGSLEVAQVLEYPMLIAQARHVLSELERNMGNLREARRYLELNLAEFNQMETTYYTQWTNSRVALLLIDEGDLVAARALLEINLSDAIQRNDIAVLGWNLYLLSRLEATEGNVQQAAAAWHEAALLEQQMGLQRRIADKIEELAGILNLGGQPAQAARLLGAVSALRKQLGVPVPTVDQHRYECYAASSKSALGEAAFAAVSGEGTAMSLDDAVAYALDCSSDLVQVTAGS
ncbi:MAG: tetratricopeptide repeat protein [Chloroflexota bacterium]|nr:tetratricopeptide repeat protein [Chloroflexota bacterium]